ncbi:MAG: a-factor receptor [Stictis urceolatum]|nr:a-factor receptor [Stictis urceolata]
MADFQLPVIDYPLNDSSFRFEDSEQYLALVESAGAGYDPYFDSASGQAIFFTIISVLALVLCVPCLAFYIKHRNIPALSIVAWLIYLNLIGIVNSLIWPTDNVSTWFLGYGWCDVTSKLSTGSQLGLVGSLCALFRGLANALDTDRARLLQSKAHRIRELVIECLFCYALPVYLIVVEYVVQTGRYYIFAISGCFPSYSESWVTLVILNIWPAIFCFVAAYFALLVTIRVWRYRSQFASILQSSGSGMSSKRFIRLYILSDVLLLVVLPVQLYVVVTNVPTNITTYSWNEVHGPDNWNHITLVPMGGVVFYDRWIRVAAGLFAFFVLGFGGEATEFYRKCLVTLGFGTIFKILNHPRTRRGNSSRRNLSSSLASSLGNKYSIFANRFRRGSHSNTNSYVLSSITTAVGPGMLARLYAYPTFIRANSSTTEKAVHLNTTLHRHSASLNSTSPTSRVTLTSTRVALSPTLRHRDSSHTVVATAPGANAPTSPLRSLNPRTSIAPEPFTSHPSLTSLYGTRSAPEDRVFSALESGLGLGLDGASDDPDTPAVNDADAEADPHSGTNPDSATTSRTTATGTHPATPTTAAASPKKITREKAKALLPRLHILRRGEKDGKRNGKGESAGGNKGGSPREQRSAGEWMEKMKRKAEYEDSISLLW